MRNLIIIGAGGMGRTIYDMALENNGYLKDFQIKGFIDDDIHQLDRFGYYPPIISLSFLLFLSLQYSNPFRLVSVTNCAAMEALLNTISSNTCILLLTKVGSFLIFLS